MPLKPKYAAYVPDSELVKVLCKKRCNKSTLHRLNPNAQTIQNANEPFAGYTATCLKCGGIATDNYNWSRP